MRVALFALVALCACSSQRKDAWRGCSAALAAGTGDCDFLRMCANEAPLDADQRARLAQRVAEKGCAPP